MKKYLALLSSLMLTLWMGTATYGADSASFDPVPIQVSAQGAGGVPVGTVVAWPVAANPEDWENWLECNGQSTIGYPELAAVVGPNVPNYQGMFLRGFGAQTSYHWNAVSHSSGALGALQGDSIRNMVGDTGPINFTSYYPPVYHSGVLRQENGGTVIGMGGAFIAGARITFNAALQVPTANENRPVNMAVRYLIRARL